MRCVRHFHPLAVQKLGKSSSHFYAKRAPYSSTLTRGTRALCEPLLDLRLVFAVLGELEIPRHAVKSKALLRVFLAEAAPLWRGSFLSINQSSCKKTPCRRFNTRDSFIVRGLYIFSYYVYQSLQFYLRLYQIFFYAVILEPFNVLRPVAERG